MIFKKLTSESLMKGFVLNAIKSISFVIGNLSTGYHYGYLRDKFKWTAHKGCPNFQEACLFPTN
jgi:hypothetical protein